MRGEHSGSGRNRQDRNRNPQGNQGGEGYEQADGSGADDWQDRLRRRAQGGRSSGSTGMGDFADGDFQGGAGGFAGREQHGYGQDESMRGGYGQGSGYAQSSGMGGYGQSANQQGGRGQSGADQHSDERYGQHFGSSSSQNDQRQSPYGYGGRGAQQQGGQSQFGSRYPGGSGSPSESRGQHHGKGPKGYQRSDERIREDVSEQLYHDGDVDASEIEIEVSAGEVTLTGTVSSRHEKRRAEEVAEHCAGVKDVQNRLRVQTGHSASISHGGAAQSGSQTSGSQASGSNDDSAQPARTSISTGA